MKAKIHVFPLGGRTALLAWALATSALGPITAAEEERVTIQFPNGTLDQVIALYAELTHRTAIRASALQGRIVLQGNGPLARADAIEAIENVLSANGFSVVIQGEKFFKVVPSEKVKQEGVRVTVGGEPLSSADQVASRVFQLKFADVKDVQPSLQPAIHAYGQITPFPRTNSLLITDTAANLAEIARLIEHVDRPPEAKVKTRFYALKNAKARDVLARITELLRSASERPTPAPVASAPAEGTAPPAEAAATAHSPGGELSFSEESVVAGRVTVSADERTNQVILLTREVNFAFFDQMIGRLDADTAAPVLLKTMALRYAEAGELSGLINQVLGRGGPATTTKKERLSQQASSSPYSAAKTAPSPVPSSGEGSVPAAAGAGPRVGENLSVHPDARTNSLIVMGTASEIEWVRGFVKDVDVLLAQVLIEGVVVEVTLSREDNFGVSVLSRATGGQLAQAALVKTLSANPLDASTISTATLPTGLPLGLNYFATLRDSKVDVLVQALAQKNNVRILSQPIIQTSHNEEAKIVVAEARPVVTTTATDITGSQGTLRSSYEYKDIGLQLTIRPRVNPDGLVVLDILQRVDNINGFQNIDGNQIPIIARREAGSVVSVADGSMVILGGLVENRETGTKSGVPVLSDIPLLGYLFGATSKRTTRTELMVLLKPTVLRTPEAASGEAAERRKALELFRQRSLPDTILGRKNLSERIDAIERPVAPRAEAVEWKEGSDE